MKAALELSVALEVMALIDVGILAVDRSCKVLHANALAESLLRQHPDLSIVRRHLTFTTHALQDRFSLLLRSSLLAAMDCNPSAAAVLRVSGTNRLPTTLRIAPLPLDGEGPPTLAIVLIRDPQWPEADRHCLRELFGLTPAEAVVATDLIRGLLPDQIARRRRIGLTTVRSHISNITSKTGTRRMAQAVAVISRSVATLTREPGHP